MIISLFLLIQSLPIVSWLLGTIILPLRLPFLGFHLNQVSKQPFIWSRANFDGFHYISIAQSGYGYLQEAFFPLYPRLISLVQKVVPGFAISGIIISSVCFFLVLILFRKLISQVEKSPKVIKNTLLWLVVFPTSFYFVLVYSESLFLLFVLLSFWFSGQKKWFFAGLFAGIASNARIVGIFLIPALLYDYYVSELSRTMKERIVDVSQNFLSRFKPKFILYFLKTRAKHFKNLLFISVGSLGLFKYMNFLHNTTGDPLKFVHVQADFGANRTPNEVIMLYQVFWRYLKMIFTVDIQSFLYFNVWLEFLIAILFIGLMIIGWFKYKIRNGWMIFSILSFLLPAATGTFSSMPRYVLVAFPMFYILSKLDLPKWVYGVSLGLQLICAMLFVRGYWIA